MNFINNRCTATANGNVESVIDQNPYIDFCSLGTVGKTKEVVVQVSTLHNSCSLFAPFSLDTKVEVLGRRNIWLG